MKSPLNVTLLEELKNPENYFKIKETHLVTYRGAGKKTGLTDHTF